MTTRSAILGLLASFLAPDGAGNILLAQSPPQFDISQKLATTQFLQNSGLFYGFVDTVITTKVMTAADAGKLQYLGGSNPYSVTLPAANSLPEGATLSFLVSTNVNVNISCAGTDVFQLGATNPTVIPMAAGDTLRLVSNGQNLWVCDGGSVQLGSSATFGQSLGGSGYKKLSGGFLLQYGTNTVGPGSHAVITFPISFPNNALVGSASVGSTVDSTVPAGAGIQFLSASAFNLYNLSNELFAIGWIVLGR